MSINVPVVRQFSFLRLILQILIIGAIIYFYDQIGLWEPLIFGMLSYSMLAFFLRNLFAHQHRKGVRLSKQQSFSAALPHFQQSLKFFADHPWIDRYRSVTLLSASNFSYREMALCGIAFCYAQLGDRQLAIKYYKDTLVEFPKNGLAITALRMLLANDERNSVLE